LSNTRYESNDKNEEGSDNEYCNDEDSEDENGGYQEGDEDEEQGREHSYNGRVQTDYDPLLGMYCRQNAALTDLDYLEPGFDISDDEEERKREAYLCNESQDYTEGKCIVSWTIRQPDKIPLTL
jgi:hypothetical protein